MFFTEVQTQNTEVIPGKGFHESLQWSNYFGKVIFLCFSDTGKYQMKQLRKNYMVIAVPFDLTASVKSSIMNLLQNYLTCHLWIFLE